MAEMRDLVRLRTKLSDEKREHEKRMAYHSALAKTIEQKLLAVERAILMSPEYTPPKMFSLSTGEKITITEKQRQTLLQNRATNAVETMLARLQKQAGENEHE